VRRPRWRPTACEIEVHPELGNHFIRAIDARHRRVVNADHKLVAGDLTKIVASK
jgi:hypothetical protein